MNLSRRASWVCLLVLTTLALGFVAVPVFLIKPFAPQTPTTLALAFFLRRWSPLLTLLAGAAGIWLVWRIWRATSGRRPRILAAVPLALTVALAWMARQNHFEWMFAPLPDSRFVRAAEAGFVAPDDMVLAVVLAGDPVAYPVRQLAYHHLVEDAVGRVPIVATY
jgi:hypothetical protein